MNIVSCATLNKIHICEHKSSGFSFYKASVINYVINCD